MTLSVQEITGKEQWDGFLTRQPRGHLHQKDYQRQILRQFASKLFPFPSSYHILTLLPDWGGT